MTDFDTFTAMLTAAGVDWVQKDDERFCNGPVVELGNWAKDPVDHLMAGEAGTRGVPGYSGFETAFYFSAEGDLVAIGSWE